MRLGVVWLSGWQAFGDQSLVTRNVGTAYWDSHNSETLRPSSVHAGLP